MNRINKIILCGLLLCLFGAAGKGYGQEVDRLSLITSETQFTNFGWPEDHLPHYSAVAVDSDSVLVALGMPFNLPKP